MTQAGIEGQGAGARVAVVGAGAIGGIVAARMAMAGHTVGVVARGEHLRAIQDRGLTLDDRVGGARHTIPLAATESPAELVRRQGVPDLLVIGLKAHSIPEMAQAIAPMVGPQTIVVPAINGLPWWYFHREGSSRDGQSIRCLDPQGELARHLDAERIVGCVVYVSGEVPEPGTVAHTANRRMVVGDPAGGVTPRLQRLAHWWNGSGFECAINPVIRQEIWSKLLGNLSFNPVCAITGLRTDAVLADPGLVDILRAMIDEARQVALAYGIDPAVDTEARIRAARSIGSARPSTLQDFEGGRRPEVEGLLGCVIELADAVGLSVPMIRHLSALLCARARQLGLLPPLTERGDPR